MNIELYKLIRKKITYLLLVPLIVPLIYGIGLNSNLQLVVDTEGQSVELISKGIGLFEFLYTMLGVANFIFLFAVSIICSMLMAREIESDEINPYVYRIGKRDKIVISKFFSMQVLITVYYFVNIVLSLIMYLIHVRIHNYEIKSILGFEVQRYVIAIIAMYLGTLAFASFSIMIGIYQSAFTTFFVTFILYILTSYLEHFSMIKSMFPEHFAKDVVSNGVNEIYTLLYLVVFAIYVVIFLGFGVIFFRRRAL